ncbi:ABC transporter permease [Paenibacillus sp. NPDC058071]|uniref:ABC transporter permease n=1 Tax=Paenibacillus sp. NPDC058071 TaxID=3346326 RepID=UPI0036DAEED9
MNAVWKLTWKELLRKKVTLMTVLLTLLFLGAFWFVSGSFAVEQQPINDMSNFYEVIGRFQSGSVILSLGFFFAAFAVAFLSIFSSVSAVGGEAEQGVLQSVLARPLPRWRYYLGRWFGFTAFGLLYALLLFAVIIWIAYLRTGLQIPFDILFLSYLLFASPIPLLVSMTMLGSCWLSTLGNGIAMTMLFSLGWLGNMIEKVKDVGIIKPEGIATLEVITGLIRLIMPADSLQQRMLAELFSMKEFGGLVGHGGILSLFMVSSPSSNAFLIYAAVFTVVFILAGLLSIHKKDF